MLAILKLLKRQGTISFYLFFLFSDTDNGIFVQWYQVTESELGHYSMISQGGPSVQWAAKSKGHCRSSIQSKAFRA